VFSNYLPNHNFFGPDNRDMAVGIVNFPGREAVHPGESADAEILFFGWPELSAEIRAGREWSLHEGARVIAVGTVLEVIE
jgi:elongation factor Tu